ncbi:MAG: hypothetical protein M5T52_08160 [Ignavibacteriaceae bacterium]|nr:hypothetical protein [Ignavibacteriaceae bacterium]
MIDLKKLNPDQQKAVEFTGPAQMIVAGLVPEKQKYSPIKLPIY